METASDSEIPSNDEAPLEVVEQPQLLDDGLTECDAVKPESLESQARKCDLAIGETVPDFDCDNGTLVPTTNAANGLCDRPNVLSRVCDPGSRFQVLKQTATVAIVAHCRKKNQGANYGDIAVIQYNKSNGATCFYQALGDALPPRVSAPS